MSDCTCRRPEPIAFVGLSICDACARWIGDKPKETMLPIVPKRPAHTDVDNDADRTRVKRADA